MLIKTRYSNPYAATMDQIAHIIAYFWLTLLSLFLSCYTCTTPERQHPEKKLVHFVIYGPLCGFLVATLLPFGIFGIFLWVVVCTLFSQQKYSYKDFKQESFREDEKKNDCFMNVSENENNTWKIYTVASMNLLLAMEFLGKFSNLPCVYNRVLNIGRRLLRQTGKPVLNLLHSEIDETKSFKKEDAVLTSFPQIHFICFQEVWERIFSWTLIHLLMDDYPYFIYDVGEFKMTLNYCIYGSGLMFASKYPVLDTDFRTFSCRTSYAHFLSYGILCVKVNLGNKLSGAREVGYITNVHTQAPVEKNIIYTQLSDTVDFVNQFVTDTVQPGDCVAFDVICGDFNFDNISPCDRLTRQHPLLQQYVDVCRVREGVDQLWAVGTEVRQNMLHDVRIATPQGFRDVLVDDTLRRHYIMDADIKVERLEWFPVKPKPNRDGKVDAVPWGGMRRIDQILYRPLPATVVAGFCFVSALNGLTDHVPVCMSIKAI